MKKVISILLVVAMLSCFMVTTVSADETVATAHVSGAAVSANIGDTVTMGINISNNPGYRSFKVVLGYDASALEVVSVSGNVTSNTNTAGKVIATFASATKVEGNGQLFSVTFKVIAKTCGTYNVSVGVSELYTDGTVAIPFTTGSGSVTANHDWVATDTVAPTCYTQGYTVYVCSKCGATKNDDYVNGGHVPGDAVKENVKASTCTAHGSYDLVVYCKVCGEELSRETKSSDLAAHNRAVSIKDDVYHTWTCKACSDAYDEKHTIEEDDYHYWCEICGWEKEKDIPVSPDPEEPVLGDVESQFNFGLVALIAIACGAAYICKRKFVK